MLIIEKIKNKLLSIDIVSFAEKISKHHDSSMFRKRGMDCVHSFGACAVTIFKCDYTYSILWRI
jgi:hypothetical protein